MACERNEDFDGLGSVFACLRTRKRKRERERKSEVHNLFRTCIRTGIADHARQGLVPDFMIRSRPGSERELMELKFIHQSKYLFPTALTGRCSGVARRAALIHGEYVRKAAKADEKYNSHHPEDGLGPIGRRLEEFGRIKGLVVGPRGEASDDFHSLVQTVAGIAAERRWRSMGARSPLEARAHITDKIVLHLGIIAIRENAAHKRAALEISTGHQRSGSKGSYGRHFFDFMQEEYEARYGSGPAPPCRH